jgi:hypothetical protein
VIQRRIRGGGFQPPSPTIKTNAKKIWLLIMSVICLARLVSADPEPSNTNIINGTDRKDTKGNPIAAHEGDIARFNGVFYWYGSSYANNPKGLFRMPAGPVWNGVQVYSSTDLKNWTYKGVCLPRPEKGFGKLGATGRSHVIYNQSPTP